MSSSYRPIVSSSPVASTLLNGLLFNISWLAIVMTQSSLLAPAIAATHLMLHFRFFSKGAPEWRLILLVSLLGFAIDQVLFLLGLFTRDSLSPFAPFWLSCLWPVLATTFMHAFRSLQARPLLAGLFGAVGGTLSYLAGTRLSEIAFTSELWGPAIIAVIWALLFPFLLLGANIAESAEQRRRAL